MHVEHIGLAVDEVATVVETFEKLLGREPYKSETVSSQQVRTHFLDAETTKLEFLEALGAESPIQKFLDRRGEGLHHVAFAVSDLEATMARLRDAGFELLSETPQTGADDKAVVFVHPQQTHGVLVEFCASQTPDWSPTRIPRHNDHLSVYERGPDNCPPLLVLHGAAGTTRHEMAPLIRRLESSFHVVGVDLSGHGASAMPDGAFALDLFAADVRTVLDALDLRDAHVFGFSLGGGVALHLAAETPDRVRRLAVLQTTVDWTEAQAAQMKQRLALDTLKEQAPGRAEQLHSRHANTARLLRRLQAFVDTLPAASATLADAFPTLTAPTLVAAMDRDPLFELDDALALHRRLDNARLTILPGTRHNFAQVPLPSLTPLLTRHYLDAE